MAADLERFHDLDEDFHRSFCAAAGLEGVWSTILIAKARVDRVHRLASEAGRLPQVIVEHGAILDALDAATAERAAERLDYHLERAPSIMEGLIGSTRNISSNRTTRTRAEQDGDHRASRIRMVDLKPKTKRVDAIQSFVSQETPFVCITDSDGAIGVGYSYTIGTGGPAIVELLARSLAPALIGREAGQVAQIWRDLLFLTHATSVGALHQPRARCDPAAYHRVGRPLYARPRQPEDHRSVDHPGRLYRRARGGFAEPDGNAIDLRQWRLHAPLPAGGWA